ncbi:peptidyl-prolyl cis-trans isomerase [Caminibacter sp.]
MRKIFFLIAISIFLRAEIIDKVIASVNNEPITSYEISKVENQMHMTPNQALNYLIDQKLLNEELKKRGIEIDDFDIDQAMENIANKNGMTLFEFKRILKQRGEYKKFRNSLKQKLLKEKLFSQIVNSNLKISPIELKNYYNNHKNEFTVFKTVQVTQYTANNPEILQKIKQNPLYNQNVNIQTKVYSYNEIPQNLMFLFKTTKVGEFTPVINNGTNYTMYYISRKDGKVILPFDKVKNIIANKILAQKREEILRTYFDRLKNQANIKIYNN